MLALVISIPLGVYCAVNRNSLIDRVVTVLTTAFSSIPPSGSG
jgi:ABC-type dipeptide/oligopeptide/nickel transport system permease component